MEDNKSFTCLEIGHGQPIVLLHGLMGDLRNFNAVMDYFSKLGYRVVALKMPLYDMDLKDTNIEAIAVSVRDLIVSMSLKKVVLVGNSLGGHLSLCIIKKFPSLVKAIVLTGSSGLYESPIGSTYPRRGDRLFIRKKIEEVFFDPKVATDELVDFVMNVVNDRKRAIRVLALAKSATRHNVAKDLPGISVPVCLIWGKDDKVTPRDVALDFNRLLPNSDLFWIDECGHAPMMEHPEVFNGILHQWFKSKGI